MSLSNHLCGPCFSIFAKHTAHIYTHTTRIYTRTHTHVHKSGNRTRLEVCGKDSAPCWTHCPASCPRGRCHPLCPPAPGSPVLSSVLRVIPPACPCACPVCLGALLAVPGREPSRQSEWGLTGTLIWTPSQSPLGWSTCDTPLLQKES